MEFEGVAQVAGRFDGQVFIKGAVRVGAVVRWSSYAGQFRAVV